MTQLGPMRVFLQFCIGTIKKEILSFQWVDISLELLLKSLLPLQESLADNAAIQRKAELRRSWLRLLCTWIQTILKPLYTGIFHLHEAVNFFFCCLSQLDFFHLQSYEF